jgi:hypothetical protein
VLAVCVLNENVSAGVVVAVATEVVKIGLSAPALKDVTVPVPYGRAGMSAATNARNVGVAAIPEAGPAHTVFAVCVVIEKEIAGVDVGVATDTVMIVSMLPEETLVTDPYGSGGMSAATSARNVAVAADPDAGPARTKFAAGVSLRSATAG